MGFITSKMGVFTVDFGKTIKDTVTVCRSDQTARRSRVFGRMVNLLIDICV